MSEDRLQGPGALRSRREARGVSLDHASRSTRIPVAHLRAIEEGRFDDLPAGPYRAGQVRAYYTWLGLEADPELLERLRPDGPSSDDVGVGAVWAVRIVAGALCAALIGLLVWMLSGSPPVADTGSVGAAANAPDQVVVVTARRTTHLEVLVDGEVVLDREVPGGERIEVAGHRRVEVRLEGADSARVEYNGELVVPQGRQDVPRRLVFIDDLDPPGSP